MGSYFVLVLKICMIKKIKGGAENVGKHI